ncbi:MAG: hypothetical protein M3128_02465 [Verrucomicrobiota bacterium]|nr:hypothetical protein [Verrucomicrobiota bacterium]
MDGRPHTVPRATANLLIEINDAALTAGGKKKGIKVAALQDVQKVELAGKIAKRTARDFLNLEHEFNNYPVRRFVDFNLIGSPTYISIRPAPDKVLPDDSKVWRLAECESDKLRAKPLSV